MISCQRRYQWQPADNLPTIGEVIKLDLGQLLVSAGLSLAEKVVFTWFQEGRTSVKQSKVQHEVAELAKREAVRTSLREDELQEMTERLLEKLVEESPRLAYVKAPLHEPKIKLDVDLRDARSSNELLSELRSRLGWLADQQVVLAGPAPEMPQGKDISQSEGSGYKIVPPLDQRAVPGASPAAPQKHPTGRHGTASADESRSRASELLADLARRVDEKENRRE